MSRRAGSAIVAAIVIIAALGAVFFLIRGDTARLPETAAIGRFARLCRSRARSSFRRCTSRPPRAGRMAASRSRRAGSRSRRSRPACSIRAGCTCCPTATCSSPRPTRPPRPTTARASRAWFTEDGAEARRRRRAEREPDHAAARCRWRRRRRDAHVFLKDLNSPFGMALVGNDLYVANTDAIVRFPYTEGATEITEPRREGRRPARRTDQPPLDQERHRQPRRIASSM